MFKEVKILYHNGKQYIPNLTNAVVPVPFRGRPEILKNSDDERIKDFCPLGAIQINPLSIDLGKCSFCGECAFEYPENIRFTNDHKIASNIRENLIVTAETSSINLIAEEVRKEIRSVFKHSLKLRQVCAGGDNSVEFELGAAGNPNFDMGRFGIEFVASPRHADGIVLSGPITENMASALQIAYDAVPSPKILILVGVDAISGGIFADSKAVNRSFLKDKKVDLYVPGNPPHPLTFINGILELTRGGSSKL